MTTTVTTSHAVAGPTHVDTDGGLDRPPRTSLLSTLTRRVVPLGLLLVLFGLLIRYAAQPVSNPDTFFHLRFGREFLTGTWSLQHPGSVTTQGTASWLPTQWSAQMLMALANRLFGLPGVAWLGGLQFIVLAGCLYAGARRFADPLVSTSLTLIAVLASASGLSARPQVISYALVTVTVVAWLSPARRVRGPWLLVPLIWLWATYHGMWPLGIVVSIVALIGLVLDGRVDTRMALRHGGVVLTCAVVAALTPLGPKLYAAVLDVSSRGRFFSEWSPPQFTQYNNLAALALVGTAIAIALRTGRRDWTVLLLTGLATLFLVYSQRTGPVAVALVVPIVAELLQGLVGPRTDTRRGEAVTVGVGAVLALAVLAVVAPHTAVRPAPQPDWVPTSLRALPPGTPVLTDASFGGYVMWIAPQLDVVLSGYGDIYTDAEMQRNADIEHLAPGWDDDVRALRARVAVVSTSEPLGYALRQVGWRIEQQSRYVQLLIAPTNW